MDKKLNFPRMLKELFRLRAGALEMQRKSDKELLWLLTLIHDEQDRRRKATAMIAERNKSGGTAT